MCACVIVIGRVTKGLNVIYWDSVENELEAFKGWHGFTPLVLFWYLLLVTDTAFPL